MTSTENDFQIMSILNKIDKPLTPYAIAQETRLYLNQIQPRLKELVNNGVLVESNGVRAKQYELHPNLQSSKELRKIMKHMEEIAERLDESHSIKPEGLKQILNFVIQRMSVFRKK